MAINPHACKHFIGGQFIRRIIEFLAYSMSYFISYLVDKRFFNTRIDKKAFTRCHKTLSISYNNTIRKESHKSLRNLTRRTQPYPLTSVYYNRKIHSLLQFYIYYILTFKVLVNDIRPTSKIC